ncbi:MAG: EAL domain-containing protein [Actinomycetales bacterium]|nr:EAL domain-containing protein [Actinomycetales bacterium]
MAVTVTGWFTLAPSLTVDGVPVPGRPHVPWWVLAAAFTAAQSLVLQVQIHREARSVFLSEIPMMLGLLFVEAPELVAARVVGAAIASGVIHRQYRKPRKLAFNLGLAGTEATAAVAVLHALVPLLGARPPGVWLAALIATIVSTGITAVGVDLVIRLLDARLSLREVAALGLRAALDAVPVAALGAVVSAAWLGSVWSAVPVLVAFALLLCAYRSFAALNERHLSLERLYRFSQIVSSISETDDVISTVLHQARELLHAEQARVVFLPAQGRPTDPGRAASVFFLGRGDTTARTHRSWPPGNGDPWDLRRIVAGEGPLLVSRSTRDPAERDWLERLGVRDTIAVGLRGESGPIAVLAVDDRQGDVRGFDADDVQLLETVANHAATALRNGQLVDRLRHESLHDPLTLLPNRTMLQRELSRRLAEPSRPPLAVGILDLNEFKDVNDTLGHHQGDLLLREVAERLAGAVDSSVFVGRLGGDEFAIVCPEHTGEGAERIGEQLLRVFERPFLVDDLELTVSASVGISLAPDHGITPQALLKCADLAMYEAKQSGGGVRVFQPSSDTTSRSRLALVTHLRQAILADEVQIHLQPKIQLDDGSLRGVEALARWTHAEHGSVPPAEFIPLAERSGMISPLTERILRRAVEACAEWQPALPGIGVAVNISLRTLTDDSLPLLVDHLLRANALDPELLTLEITESSILSDPERILRLLRDLRARGVRLSIDDFGTGYTTLYYLRHLPVNEVKIDKSFFLYGPEGSCDPIIVRSIVDLGRNLGLSVVAEGIADQQIWNDLVTLGCELGQGNAIHAPAPPSECRDWMIAYSAGAHLATIPINVIGPS